MQPLAKFWTSVVDSFPDSRGKQLSIRVWGWSVTSLAEAGTVAQERLAQVRAKIARGEELQSWKYYPRLPLREETLAELTADDDGRLLAVVTRNRYGAEVLNTDLLVFADVDLPEPSELPHAAGRSAPGLLGRLFGRGAPEPTPPSGTPPADTPDAEAAIERIGAFARANPGLGVHIYRTAAGLRVLVSGGDLPPGSPASERVLQALDADPMYVRLCSAHKTYRARLTPKPWRCGVSAKSIAWPYPSAMAVVAERWLADYTKHAAGHATTRLVSRTGPAPSGAEAQVIALHDHVTRAQEQLPLA